MISGGILALISGALLGVGGFIGGGILGALIPIIALPCPPFPPVLIGSIVTMLVAIPFAVVGAVVVGLGAGLVGAIVTPAGLSQLHILSFFHQGFAGLVSM